MADPSFYYAIFKKFQASCGNNLAFGYGHLSADSSPELAGGFSLSSTDDLYGIHGGLSPHAPDYGLVTGFQPLNANSTDPTQSALYVMLNASVATTPAPPTVLFGGQPFPVMPPPDNKGSLVDHPEWVEFNTGSHRLIDAFATWISHGQNDDSPKNAPLTTAALLQTPPTPIPGTPDPATGTFPILFVCSMPGDDGRRSGDSSLPDVGPNHVPAHFWQTSQIFLTDAMGNTVDPPTLDSGAEYYVAAVIGNNGNWGAGRVSGSKIFVTGEAMAFNTHLSPGTLLPALSNLDLQSTNGLYEQYSMLKQSYEVAGFRFNVDTVFANIKKAMTDAGIKPVQLGGASIDAWVKASHACVKVLIVAGEDVILFPPAGNVPFTDQSDPRKDRHIAQHNLAPFNITQGAKKQLAWQNFIIDQVGAGPNGFTLQHALPSEAFRLYLAIPTHSYERYVGPKASKGGGSTRGFEMIRDIGREVAHKPFPDAVILRQTSPGATLHVADHARENFLGLSLGIEGDPADFKRVRDSDVSVVHAAQDGGIVGGFTLRAPVVR